MILCSVATVAMFAAFEPEAGRKQWQARIRSMRCSDAREVGRIHADREGIDPGEAIVQVRSWAADDGREVLVAEREGHIMGCASAALLDPPAHGWPGPTGWYLTGVVVEPASRRRGVGRALTAARLGRLAATTDTVWYFTNARTSRRSRCTRSSVSWSGAVQAAWPVCSSPKGWACSTSCVCESCVVAVDRQLLANAPPREKAGAAGTWSTVLFMIEVGARKRIQPAPPPVVFEALTQPDRPGGRSWLYLLDDEVRPEIIDGDEPVFVVWSSIWLGRADAVIRFGLPPSVGGTDLRWTLFVEEPPPMDQWGSLSLFSVSVEYHDLPDCVAGREAVEALVEVCQCQRVSHQTIDRKAA